MTEAAGRRGERGTRRRRAFVMLALALVCGGLAASQVRGRERDVERRIGPNVPVVIARSELAAGRELTPERVQSALAVRQVPERYVPRDSLATPEEAIGLRTAVALAPGSYVTATALRAPGGAGEQRRGGRVTTGERAVEVAVAGGSALAAAGSGPGRVDVLVTTEAGDGDHGRSYVALQNVELLGIRQGASESGGGEGGASAGGARTLATLRVTLRQAVYLTAAQNFARELRLLARPGGDEREAEVAAVGSDGL